MYTNPLDQLCMPLIFYIWRGTELRSSEACEFAELNWSLKSIAFTRQQRKKGKETVDFSEVVTDIEKSIGAMNNSCDCLRLSTVPGPVASQR